MAINQLSTFQQIHIIMDYCEGGDLFEKIKLQQYLSEQNAAIICQKIASALEFAHNSGILHRDIKPENIFLISRDSEVDVRLGDFGSVALFMPGIEFGYVHTVPHFSSIP